MGNTSIDILVNELVSKRAELTGALERNQAEQARLVADIGTVDAALFMFAPHVSVGKIAPKQLPPIYAAGRNEITMLALNFLREARAPISTQDLNRMIMTARNLNTNDTALVDKMRERLHSSLRNQRVRKRVRSIKSQDGKYSLWEIAE